MIDDVSGAGGVAVAERRREPSPLDIERRIAAAEAPAAERRPAAEPAANPAAAPTTAPVATPAATRSPDRFGPDGGPVAGPAAQPAPASAERPAPAPALVIPEPRRGEIDRFVAENANAVNERPVIWDDHVGGERVGQAINGQSPLGQLTPEERRYMADQAVTTWSRTHNDEAVTELAEAVARNPQGKRDVAAALAAPAGSVAQHHARGGTSLDSPEGAAFREHMLDAALDLDGPAVVDAFRGAEAELGQRLALGPADDQARVLNAVSDGRVTGEAADRLVTSTFLHADEMTTFLPESRRSMARALATVTNTDESPYRTTSRDMIAQRLEGVLSSEAGRDLLLNPEIRPELRSWALGQVTNDSSLDAAALEGGWESDVISQRFAQASIDAYRARGTEPQVLTGEALRNTVGQALGLPPDQLPGANETPAARDGRLAQGLDHQYYGANEQLDAVVGKINEMNGGDGGPVRVSVVPVSVTSNEFGAATMPVFRVEAMDGRSVVVDNQGLIYSSVEEWEARNHLPSGKMTYPAGLDLASGQTTTANTPEVIDSFGERARWVGDKAALAAGITAGVLVIAGTGGVAAPLVLGGAAAAWGIGASGSDLAELHDRGVDVTDMSNPEVRSHVINIAASTLSLGAMSAGVKLAQGGAQLTSSSARMVAGLQIVANTADAVAMDDQGIQLAQSWDKLDNGQRAAGLLNVAFWAGMGAASTRATGAPVGDAFSFGRLENQIRFGTPYEVRTSPDLESGQVRVNTRDPNNIHIETGPGPIDRAMLDLHSATARQVEATSGLQGRLRVMLGDQEPPVGSVAWETKLEIDKIGRETALLQRELGGSSVTPERQVEVEGRLGELARATEAQTARLTAAGTNPEGWIAAPPNGSRQAATRGWPPANALPEGYDWQGIRNTGPYLRSRDGGPPLAYNPDTGRFVPIQASQTDPSAPVISWSPTGNATRNAAFEAIIDHRVAAERAGTPVTDASDGWGTVSTTTNGENRVVGVNSTNLTPAEKALAQDWAGRLGVQPGTSDAKFLFHAEAHVLMQMHHGNGGRMPSEVTLYVDRDTCGDCQRGLPEMMQAMGVEKMTFEFADGRRAVIENGVYRRVD